MGPVSTTPRAYTLLAAYSVIVTTLLVLALTPGGYFEGRSDSSAGGRGNRRGRVDPEDPAATAAYFKLYGARKFEPLIINLRKSLGEEGSSRIRSILIEREIRLAAAGRQLGKTRKNIENDSAQIQSDIKSRLLAEFGSEILQKTETFIKTLSQRALVGGFNQELVYEGEPLTVDEIESLISILAKNAEENKVGFKSVHEVDTYILERKESQTHALQEATAFLNARQLEALQREFDLEIAYIRRHRERMALVIPNSEPTQQ